MTLFNEWLRIERNFVRVGRWPRRWLLIAHRSRALFSTRQHGFRLGNWFFVFDWIKTRDHQ